MEHTKGEWYWALDDEGRPHNLRCKSDDGTLDEHILFAGLDFADTYAFANSEANAKLIASAPELLEACKKIVRLSDTGIGIFPNLVRDMRQAIAKAEGGK